MRLAAEARARREEKTIDLKSMLAVVVVLSEFVSLKLLVFF